LKEKDSREIEPSSFARFFLPAVITLALALRLLLPRARWHPQADWQETNSFG